ncbi:methyltransferase domain-containing protein [Streptomyces sp. NBC_00344]
MFPAEARGEGERIDLGARAYDGVTMARLKALGAGPGWDCLDVGAGTGSVARLLLQDAGVARVVAVDQDVRFLEAHPIPGLTAVRADITAEDFHLGRFRLVHARFVLMHLADRERLVTALSRMLAPGGVLVLSDAADPVASAGGATDTPFTRVMRAMWQGLRESIGTDISWVATYPQLLRGAGLAAVAAELHVPPLEPGSPISRFWADTWDRSRTAMLATGLVDDAAIAAGIRYLDSPECAGLSPGMITCWGRKPEETGRAGRQ